MLIVLTHICQIVMCMANNQTGLCGSVVLDNHSQPRAAVVKSRDVCCAPLLSDRRGCGRLTSEAYTSHTGSVVQKDREREDGGGREMDVSAANCTHRLVVSIY